MGAGLQLGGALGSRRARRRSARPMSEINVTPFVDVMLVLLIIFMVTAPLLTVGVNIDSKAGLPEVELPQTEAGAVTPEKAPLNITVDPGGRIFLQNTEIGFDELVSKLAAIRDAGGAEQVWVRGDKAAAYGSVARVLVRIKEAGLPVTLVTDQVEQR
ncbi:ExbD/TolR family protein [Methyloceanibacter sp.]|jgi:biopolymer transport protein TolR|uniref:ExbD/TolR family protein n=1 Tax=Methyloceanibacter sp. TaxID=1965321 RepID=UPI00351B6513